MIVASDSTTLIVLFDLEKPEYLTNIFGTILIPRAVFKELNAKQEVALPKGFEVVDIKEDEHVELLSKVLDRGESEAIALGIQRNIPLIIDEKKGRKIAQNLGVSILDLLGVIYLNITKGYISHQEATSFLDDVLRHGFRIAPSLINAMLERAR